MLSFSNSKYNPQRKYFLFLLIMSDSSKSKKINPKLKKELVGKVERLRENKDYQKKVKENAEKHAKINKLMNKTTKKPVIVNKDSNFVVITYWWGRIKNRNTSRACLDTIQRFLKGGIDIAKPLSVLFSDWNRVTRKVMETKSIREHINLWAKKFDDELRYYLNIPKNLGKNAVNDKKMKELILPLIQKGKLDTIPSLQEKSISELKDLIKSLDNVLSALEPNRSVKEVYKSMKVNSMDNKESLVYLANELLAKVAPHKYHLESRHIKADFEYKSPEELKSFLFFIMTKYLEECNNQPENPVQKISKIEIEIGELQKDLKKNKDKKEILKKLKKLKKDHDQFNKILKKQCFENSHNCQI